MNRLFRELHRKSREKRHRLFLELMRPAAKSTILNVGATGRNTGLAEQLEHWYGPLERITGGGLFFQETLDYRASFPGVRPVVFDGCALPFADQSFDIVYSNAVLEHLPDRNSVARFAGEIQRVGRSWFVSTPNRWYPVDPHYHLPFVQFLPQANQKRLVTQLGKVPYDHLNLLSSADLRELFPTSRVIGCRVTFYPETLIAYYAQPE
jgi:SAM-dependent methyltransferase